jgi:muramidase (phage lysozyme)
MAGRIGKTKTRAELERLGKDPNVQKMMAAIAWAESKGQHDVIVGGKRIKPGKEHPGIFGTQDWNKNSTAAGQFQITRTSWREAKKHIGDLDFSNPQDQYLAALYLADRRKTDSGSSALDEMAKGNYAVAGQALEKEWAAIEHLGGGAKFAAKAIANTPKVIPGQAYSADQVRQLQKDNPGRQEYNKYVSEERGGNYGNVNTPAPDATPYAEQVDGWQKGPKPSDVQVLEQPPTKPESEMTPEELIAHKQTQFQDKMGDLESRTMDGIDNRLVAGSIESQSVNPFTRYWLALTGSNTPQAQEIWVPPEFRGEDFENGSRGIGWTSMDKVNPDYLQQRFNSRDWKEITGHISLPGGQASTSEDSNAPPSANADGPWGSQREEHGVLSNFVRHGPIGSIFGAASLADHGARTVDMIKQAELWNRAKAAERTAQQSQFTGVPPDKQLPDNMKVIQQNPGVNQLLEQTIQSMRPGGGGVGWNPYKVQPSPNTPQGAAIQQNAAVQSFPVPTPTVEERKL